MIPDNSNLVTQNLLIGGLPINENNFNMIKNNGVTIFINLMNIKEA